VKTRYIIIILALLVVTVGVDSAAAETFYLTEKNINPGYSGLPDGSINVSITREGDTLTVEDFSPIDNSSGTGYVVGGNIKEVGYNFITLSSDNNATQVIGYTNNIPIKTNGGSPVVNGGSNWLTFWDVLFDSSMDGFGDFSNDYRLKVSSAKPDKVVLTIPNTNPFDPVIKNGVSSTVSVHYAFTSIRKSDGALAPWTGPSGQMELIDSLFLGGKSTEVPEFPSIIVPVAAILGLMLILGRRKNE
jgi:hypothetical protein